MNDPTVVALIYRIEHGASVDYSEAKPLRREEPGFRVEIKDGKARFEFKGHYATEQAARQAIEGYIRKWEFTAGLQRGPDCFRLRPDRSEIEDRNPTPGVVTLHAPGLRVEVSLSRPSGTVGALCYPQPPSGIELTSDVESMHEHYMNYLQDKELLTSMAYYCLTVLEKLFKGRKEAARQCRISPDVLCEIGKLSTQRGGPQARKADGKDQDLTDQECRFLKEATRVLIERAAQKDRRTLPELTKSDLLRTGGVP